MAEKPNGLWVRIQAAAWMDPAVMAVKPLAELLFYRSIMHAKMTGTGGYIHPESIRTLTRDLHKSSLLPPRLLQQRLWTPHEESGGFTIRGYAKYNPDTPLSEDEPPGRRRNSARRPAPKPHVSDDTETPRARGLQTNVTNNGSDRTPSGSVRSEPARRSLRRRLR